MHINNENLTDIENRGTWKLRKKTCRYLKILKMNAHQSWEKIRANAYEDRERVHIKKVLKFTWRLRKMVH